MTKNRYGLWRQMGKLLRANVMMTYLGFMRANRRGKVDAQVRPGHVEDRMKAVVREPRGDAPLDLERRIQHD